MMRLWIVFFFFFSSRRRHTRCGRDWSSDVCSSDLATPGPYEMGQAGGEFVEQVIRPTGLVDPEVIVKPTEGQIDDLVHEIRERADRDERVLVTTLTKKMSEDLTDYLLELGHLLRQCGDQDALVAL